MENKHVNTFTQAQKKEIMQQLEKVLVTLRAEPEKPAEWKAGDYLKYFRHHDGCIVRFIGDGNDEAQFQAMMVQQGVAITPELGEVSCTFCREDFRPCTPTPDERIRFDRIVANAELKAEWEKKPFARQFRASKDGPWRDVGDGDNGWLLETFEYRRKPEPRLTTLVWKIREAWEPFIGAPNGSDWQIDEYCELINRCAKAYREALSLTPDDMGELVRKEELACSTCNGRGIVNISEESADLCPDCGILAENSALRIKLAEVEKERESEDAEECDLCKQYSDELDSAKARIAELETTIQFAFDEIDNRYDGAEDSKTLWLSHTLDRLHAALAKKAI